MDKTTLINERKLFIYTILSLVCLRIVITSLFYLTYETAAFLTLLTKGITFYLVYRLASVLNKPSWQKLLYAILSVFAVFYLIPFIALLVEINKKIKMEDDDIGSMSYDVNDPYELKNLKRNLNYKSLDYLHNLVLWFVRNDSKITDFEKNFEDEKILYLSQEIHQDLAKISKQEDFLDVLLKSIAYQDLALITIGNILMNYKTAFEEKNYDEVPEEEMELFYKMHMVKVYYEAKSRVLGWIYNNSYNVSFDPGLYKTRIEEFMEEILEEELNVPYDFAKDFKDYYEILEVSKKASDEIIKKAYKTLVVRYHPDTTTMIDKEEANKIFLNIQEAYEVLKDENKRRYYDKVYDKNKNMSSNINEESPNVSINQEANITVDNEGDLTAKEQINIAVEKKPSRAKKLFIITALTLTIIALLIYSSDLIKNPNYLSETASKNPDNLTMSSSNNFDDDNFFIYDHEVEMVLKGDFEYPVLIEEGYKDLEKDMDNYETLYGFIDIDSLNFRESYDAQSKAVHTLNYDDFFWVLGEKNGWYFGFYNFNEKEGKFGWASKKYITLIKYNYENSLETLVKESEYSKNNNSPNNTSLTTASEKNNEEQNTVSATTQPKQKNYFTIGSTKEEVLEIMGTPDTIYEASNRWSYNSDTVSFDKNNRVSSWSNTFGNLKVELGQKKQTDKKITIGSTKEEVLEIMGTPDTIYEASNRWSYNSDTVSFDKNNRVSSWSNTFGNLKVVLGQKKQTDKKITIGSTKEEVLEIMGTPDTIYEASNRWSYNSDTISFDKNNRVNSWSNTFGNLKLE